MALTSDRNTPARDGKLSVLPVAAGAVIHGGALVVANAAGFVAPGSTALNLTYLGRAEATADNSAGIDAAIPVLIRRKTAFKFNNAAADPVTEASLGKLCYIVDDESVALTNGTGTRSAAGIVIGIDAYGVWVE